MKRVSKKRKMLFSLIFLILCIAFFKVFYFEIADQYFSLKYSSEIQYVKNCLKILSEGEVDDVERIFDADHITISLNILEKIKKLLDRVNINSFIVRGAAKKSSDKGTSFIILIYFNKDPLKTLTLNFNKKSDKWLIRSINFGNPIIENMGDRQI